MHRADWIGLALGVAIAGTYILLQQRGLSRMRAREESHLSPAFLWGMTLRVVFFIVALVAVALWTDANKLWMVGSIAAVYGVWFSWRIRRLLSDMSRK